MFVENYKLDTMIGGQMQAVIPYPKISEEDWQTWKAFLPVKAVPFCKKELLHTEQRFLHVAYDIPPVICRQMVQGASYFEEVEIWRKRQIRKDPIAVGITANGERYLICRWGMDGLIPFEKIKQRSWLYRVQNFGVMLLTSEKFWLIGAAATLLAMTRIGT